MLVSHDRALLREVCDEFWLVADGKLAPFDGDLDDYQRWLLEQSKEAAKLAKEEAKQALRAARSGSGSASNAAAPVAAPVAAMPTAAPAPVKREERKLTGQQRQKLNEQTRPLRKEMEQIDARMKAWTEERAALEAQLSAAGQSPAQIAEAGKRLKAIGDEVEEAEMRWLELSEQVDAIMSAG